MKKIHTIIIEDNIKIKLIQENYEVAFLIEKNGEFAPLEQTYENIDLINNFSTLLKSWVLKAEQKQIDEFIKKEIEKISNTK